MLKRKYGGESYTMKKHYYCLESKGKAQYSIADGISINIDKVINLKEDDRVEIVNSKFHGTHDIKFKSKKELRRHNYKNLNKWEKAAFVVGIIHIMFMWLGTVLNNIEVTTIAAFVSVMTAFFYGINKWFDGKSKLSILALYNLAVAIGGVVGCLYIYKVGGTQTIANSIEQVFESHDILSKIPAMFSIEQIGNTLTTISISILLITEYNKILTYPLDYNSQNNK